LERVRLSEPHPFLATAMQLTFVSPYLSIKAFPEISLPDFTLITGPNGAGKTHLLQALASGKIRTDLVSEPSAEIRYFDWNSLVPQKTGLFTSDMLTQLRTSVLQTVENLRNSRPTLIDETVQACRAQGVPDEYFEDIERLFQMDVADFERILGLPENASRVRVSLNAITARANRSAINHFPVDQRQEIEDIANSFKLPIQLIQQKHIFSSDLPVWGKNEFFKQSFARLFVAYRDLYLDNQFAQFQKEKGGADIDALSDEEFFAQYGVPPWDFVNTALKNAGLDFEINKPDILRRNPYQAKLTNKLTGAEIGFTQLSSGEKILTSFAFCVYYATDRRQISTLPKLLLLDEIDAPLHPSMTRNLIATITQTLVRDFNIKVVATTHSPSTVALAPEEAIYTMRPYERGLIKTSKADALNILTVGVPTLSISYDGRRQVFVESPADAITYDILYNVWKPQNTTGRSLEFISPGLRSSAGQDINTGCEIVIKVVTELADAGNTSVFGLLDWDGTRRNQHRIAVLAEGQCNGLENVLLNPLLIAAMIARDGRPNDKSQIGMDSLSYSSFLGLGQTELQKYVDEVQKAVLPEASGDQVQVSYSGGFKLSVREAYLTIDDHELEQHVLKAFPFLNVFSRPAGKLMQAIADKVLMDQPGFLPSVVGETFELLLNQSSHKD
jgi:energy-coupling factor transporter ATP-binding protein EcfA2